MKKILFILIPIFLFCCWTAICECGQEILVNTSTIGDQHLPSVCINKEGKLVIAWAPHSASYKHTDSYISIYARMFESDGSPY